MNVINVKTLALYAISLLLLPTTTNAQNNVNEKRPDSVVISRLPKLGSVSEILRNSRPNIDKEPKFLVTSSGFSNTQNNTRNFIVYEFTGLKASDMKSSILSKLTTMFKSPKDAIHTISDNIISIEGYSSNVFKYNGYSCDILFNLTIEFKDGKIRYNYPVIKQMYVDSGVIGMLRLDTNKTFQTIAENNNEQIVANYFNSIVSDLNTAAKTSDSW